MKKFEFRNLYNNLEMRVKDEGKKNSSWLMGYVQGLGNRKLTGYQFGALVDLLLVVPEDLPDHEDVNQDKPTVKAFEPKSAVGYIRP